MRTAEQERAAFQGVRISEVAQALACSREHVRNLIRAGQLNAIDISTGSQPEYRVERESFEAFIEARRVA